LKHFFAHNLLPLLQCHFFTCKPIAFRNRDFQIFKSINLALIIHIQEMKRSGILSCLVLMIMVLLGGSNKNHPAAQESLEIPSGYMYSQRAYPNGKINRDAYKQAISTNVLLVYCIRLVYEGVNY